MALNSFDDPSLNREYQATLATEKARLTRIAVALGTLLNASFAFLDVWALPSALGTVWSLRVGMNAVLFVCLAMTWHRHFESVYGGICAAIFLTLGFGVIAMIYLAGPDDLALEAYYGGLLLTTFAACTLTYVSLVLSIAMALSMIGGYTLVSIHVHDFLHSGKAVVLMANLFFLVGATVVGIAAQTMRDRYSRENYLLRLSLERDIELQEEEKRRAAYLAEHDALTGLPNRLKFEKQATEILRGTHGANEQATVLFVDINKFKPVNDTYGHGAGDRVLKVIASRLRDSLRDTDALARFGGDEFVICARISGEVASLCNKLIKAIEQPIQLREARVTVSASVGVAICNDPETPLDDLIKEADEQMYRHKEQDSHLVAVKR